MERGLLRRGLGRILLERTVGEILHAEGQPRGIIFELERTERRVQERSAPSARAVHQLAAGLFARREQPSTARQRQRQSLRAQRVGQQKLLRDERLLGEILGGFLGALQLGGHLVDLHRLHPRVVEPHDVHVVELRQELHFPQHSLRVLQPAPRQIHLLHCVIDPIDPLIAQKNGSEASAADQLLLLRLTPLPQPHLEVLVVQARADRNVSARGVQHVQRRAVRRLGRFILARGNGDGRSGAGGRLFGDLPRERALKEPRGPSIQQVQEEHAAQHGQQNHRVVPKRVLAGTAVIERQRGKALREIALRDRPHVRRGHALRGDPLDLLRGERGQQGQLGMGSHGGEEQSEKHVVVDLLVASRKQLDSVGDDFLIGRERPGVSDEHEGVVEGEIALNQHVGERGGPELGAVQSHRLHRERVGEDEVGDVSDFVDMAHLRGMRGNRERRVPLRC